MVTEVLVSAGSPSTQALLAQPDARVATVALRPVDTPRSRIELGGILIDQVDLDAALDRIDEFVASRRPRQVVTVNLDFVSIAENNRTFRETLNEADLAVADGMPLVWLSRLKGTPITERVAGVELVTESCRRAAEQGWSVFLLGAAEGVADAAGKRLQELFPVLRVVGTYSPPMGPLTLGQTAQIVNMIRAASPDLLFVAFGAPRQDLWIRNNLAALNVPVAMGVGCSLDVLAGSVRRAPRWMQSAGLEWAFRLGQEPQRLWRRYLVNDLPLLARLLWAREPQTPEVVPTPS